MTEWGRPVKFLLPPPRNRRKGKGPAVANRDKRVPSTPDLGGFPNPQTGDGKSRRGETTSRRTSDYVSGSERPPRGSATKSRRGSRAHAGIRPDNADGGGGLVRAGGVQAPDHRAELVLVVGGVAQPESRQGGDRP